MRTRELHRTALWLAALALTFLACGKVYDHAETPRTFTLPAGTELFVTPTEGLDLPGDAATEWTFAGVLASPLEIDGELVAPKGAPVAGTATRRAAPSDADAGENSEPADVGIALQSVTVASGEAVAVSTAPVYPVLPQRESVSDIRDEDVLTFVLNDDVELSLAIPVQPVSEDNS